jgi:signal transduction histidine kinase
MSADNGRTLISITNNGKPPKCAITESGGLLSLRRDVENLGGSVQIESEPEFNLIMRF